ncbi:Golgi-associated plant pathogenesis-related protein 1-like [Ptychodera flava]|uniref:Golgi-associated plant pathogenesis-related protein 1-like n=1 Tax=Ptychodera flava TaxID=63121 RepID=UPI003969C24E
MKLLGDFTVLLLANIVSGAVIKQQETSGTRVYARRDLGVQESSLCVESLSTDYPYICNSIPRCLYFPGKTVGDGTCQVCNGNNECSDGEDEEGCLDYSKQYGTANGQCPVPSQSKLGENAPSFDSQMLEAHNYFRCLHDSPSMTTSSAMKTRATTAVENSAATGELIHTFEGENLAIMVKMPIADATGFGLTKIWYDEIVDYNYDDYTQSTGVVGHYTQVVWADSANLGCAHTVDINDDTQIACEYDPPGNLATVAAHQENVKRPI